MRIMSALSLRHLLLLLAFYFAVSRRISRHIDEESLVTFRHSLLEVGAEEESGNTTTTTSSRRLIGTSKATSPEDHRITSLPGLSPSTKLVQFAGHLLVDEAKGGNLFYWLFEKPIDAPLAPLLIWMNGGPGCSSMDGLFLELGPLRLDGEKLDHIKINPDSWHNAANLLFVDQPVGTGLSYTLRQDGYAGSDEVINEHFYKFLLAFFSLHSNYVTTRASDGRKVTRPLFMSGESHAGHYIPCMASYILKRNAAAGPNDLLISLEGIAMGNPWSDPINQYDVSEFAHGLGLITQGQKNRLKEMNRECRDLLKAGKFNQKVCFALLDDIIDSTSMSGSRKVLMYDARRFVHSTHVYPPGHEAVEVYLNRADVKLAIHATGTPQKYVECADPPFNALAHQDGVGVTTELIHVLNTGTRVLIYSGQFDIICNHMGTEVMLRNLPWTGQQDWLKAQPGVWLVDKQPSGYITSYRNLHSLLVLDSGHMVPMDMPAQALDMISRFIENKPFSSGNARVDVVIRNPDGDCSPAGSGARGLSSKKLRANVASASSSTSASAAFVRPSLLNASSIVTASSHSSEEHTPSSSSSFSSSSSSSSSFSSSSSSSSSSYVSGDNIDINRLCQASYSSSSSSSSPHGVGTTTAIAEDNPAASASIASSPCAVTMTFSIGPLASGTPWIESLQLSFLKHVFANDVRAALKEKIAQPTTFPHTSQVRSLSSSSTSEEDAMQAINLRGDKQQSVMLPLMDFSVSMADESKAAQQGRFHQPKNDQEVMLRATVNVRGTVADVLRVAESLLEQVSDTSSSLRRGLLTSSAQPVLHLEPSSYSSSSSAWSSSSPGSYFAVLHWRNVLDAMSALIIFFVSSLSISATQSFVVLLFVFWLLFLAFVYSRWWTKGKRFNTRRS